MHEKDESYAGNLGPFNGWTAPDVDTFDRRVPREFHLTSLRLLRLDLKDDPPNMARERRRSHQTRKPCIYWFQVPGMNIFGVNHCSAISRDLWPVGHPNWWWKGRESLPKMAENQVKRIRIYHKLPRIMTFVAAQIFTHFLHWTLPDIDFSMSCLAQVLSIGWFLCLYLSIRPE